MGLQRCMRTDFGGVAAVLLDVDGVLWRGEEVIGELAPIFQALDADGVAVRITSNTSTQSGAACAMRLSTLGARVSETDVITASMVTARHLAETFPEGGRVFVIGESSLEEYLGSAGFSVNRPGEVVAVVVGLDRQLTYAKLREATLHIRAGALFVAVNVDAVIPSPQGLLPAAGATVAALERATGRNAIVMGKPQPAIYEAALASLGLEPADVLVVGDQLGTDILCAQQLGCRTALVLSGVTDADEAKQWAPAADVIAADLREVVGMISQAKRRRT